MAAYLYNPNDVIQKDNYFSKLDGYVAKFGKMIYVYLSFSTVGTSTIEPVAHLKKFLPVASYGILSVRDSSAPYLECGTIWIGKAGTITGYGAPGGRNFYATGSWMTE